MTCKIHIGWPFFHLFDTKNRDQSYLFFVKTSTFVVVVVVVVLLLNCGCQYVEQWWLHRFEMCSFPCLEQIMKNWVSNWHEIYSAIIFRMVPNQKCCCQSFDLFIIFINVNRLLSAIGVELICCRSYTVGVSQYNAWKKKCLCSLPFDVQCAVSLWNWNEIRNGVEKIILNRLPHFIGWIAWEKTHL